MRTAGMTRISLLLIMTVGLILCCSCNKTAEDTNKPVIITGFEFTVDGDSISPSGTLQIEPGSILTIDVIYTDPDAGDDVDPGWYSYAWAVERIGTGVSTFNPNEFFVVSNENPGIWTGPAVTGFYRFIVEVRDRYGTPSQESVVVEVNDNKAPVISGFEITNPSPFVNEETTITVGATDPDGDLPLEWVWQATGGFFTQEGEGEASWQSPEAGTFQLTVIITDQKNGVTSRSLPVIVQQNHAPIIQGFDLDPGNAIQQGTLVTITINASDVDNDDLEYNWSLDKGTFNSVNENTAIWRAPDEVVSCTVTCQVEDNRGGSDSVDIVINVIE